MFRLDPELRRQLLSEEALAVRLVGTDQSNVQPFPAGAARSRSRRTGPTPPAFSWWRGRAGSAGGCDGKGCGVERWTMRRPKRCLDTQPAKRSESHAGWVLMSSESARFC